MVSPSVNTFSWKKPALAWATSSKSWPRTHTCAVVFKHDNTCESHRESSGQSSYCNFLGKAPKDYLYIPLSKTVAVPGGLDTASLLFLSFNKGFRLR